MGASEADFGTPDTGAEQVSPEPEGPGLSPYAQNFLGQIEDPNEKAILQKHIANWDSGFTKQMQKHSAAARQYQQYGSPEEIGKYVNFVQSFRADPHGMIQQLIDEFGYTPAQAKAAVEEELDQNTVKLPAQYEEKLGKIDSVEKALKYLLRSQQQQENIRRQQEEDAALDRATGELKKKYGDFNEQLVYTIAHHNGGDLESAVQEYRRLVQEEVNKRGTTQAPKIMSGSTLPPLERKASELTSQERKNRIAQALSQLGT